MTLILCSAVRKAGLDDTSAEVANLVSHAVEEKLRNMLEKMSTVAEHRLGAHKTDQRFVGGLANNNEIRNRLKFLEELDKLEKKRHEDAEREVLLRAVRSRAKNEDPEQLKLKEKAKAVSSTYKSIL